MKRVKISYSKYQFLRGLVWDKPSNKSRDLEITGLCSYRFFEWEIARFLESSGLGFSWTDDIALADHPFIKKSINDFQYEISGNCDINSFFEVFIPRCWGNIWTKSWVEFKTNNDFESVGWVQSKIKRYPEGNESLKIWIDVESGNTGDGNKIRCALRKNCHRIYRGDILDTYASGWIGSHQKELREWEDFLDSPAGAEERARRFFRQLWHVYYLVGTNQEMASRWDGMRYLIGKIEWLMKNYDFFTDYITYYKTLCDKFKKHLNSGKNSNIEEVEKACTLFVEEHYSLTQLAKKFGKSPSTVSDWIHGKAFADKNSWFLDPEKREKLEKVKAERALLISPNLKQKK